MKATIRNTGKRAAEEIVQLYIHNVVASITRPVRQLKGFQRVMLAPGRKQDGRVHADARGPAVQSAVDLQPDRGARRIPPLGRAGPHKPRVVSGSFVLMPA